MHYSAFPLSTRRPHVLYSCHRPTLCSAPPPVSIRLFLFAVHISMMPPPPKPVVQQVRCVRCVRSRHDRRRWSNSLNASRQPSSRDLLCHQLNLLNHEPLLDFRPSFIPEQATNVQECKCTQISDSDLLRSCLLYLQGCGFGPGRTQPCKWQRGVRSCARARRGASGWTFVPSLLSFGPDADRARKLNRMSGRPR